MTVASVWMQCLTWFSPLWAHHIICDLVRTMYSTSLASRPSDLTCFVKTCLHHRASRQSSGLETARHFWKVNEENYEYRDWSEKTSNTKASLLFAARWLEEAGHCYSNLPSSYCRSSWSMWPGKNSIPDLMWLGFQRKWYSLLELCHFCSKPLVLQTCCTIVPRDGLHRLRSDGPNEHHLLELGLRSIQQLAHAQSGPEMVLELLHPEFKELLENTKRLDAHRSVARWAAELCWIFHIAILKASFRYHDDDNLLQSYSALQHVVFGHFIAGGSGGEWTPPLWELISGNISEVFVESQHGNCVRHICKWHYCVVQCSRVMWTGIIVLGAGK